MVVVIALGSKSKARGADFVMLGGMLAGHDEGGGKVVTKHIATGGAYFLLKKEHLCTCY